MKRKEFLLTITTSYLRRVVMIMVDLYTISIHRKHNNKLKNRIVILHTYKINTIMIFILYSKHTILWQSVGLLHYNEGKERRGIPKY